MADVTHVQIAAPRFDPHRPLVNCDVDDVAAHITRDFERCVASLGP